MRAERQRRGGAAPRASGLGGAAAPLRARQRLLGRQARAALGWGRRRPWAGSSRAGSSAVRNGPRASPRLCPLPPASPSRGLCREGEPRAERGLELLLPFFSPQLWGRADIPETQHWEVLVVHPSSVTIG